MLLNRFFKLYISNRIKNNPFAYRYNERFTVMFASLDTLISLDVFQIQFIGQDVRMRYTVNSKQFPQFRQYCDIKCLNNESFYFECSILSGRYRFAGMSIIYPGTRLPTLKNEQLEISEFFYGEYAHAIPFSQRKEFLLWHLYGPMNLSPVPVLP